MQLGGIPIFNFQEEKKGRGDGILLPGRDRSTPHPTATLAKGTATCSQGWWQPCHAGQGQLPAAFGVFLQVLPPGTHLPPGRHAVHLASKCSLL